MLEIMLKIKNIVLSRMKAFSALFLVFFLSIALIVSTGSQEPPEFEKEVSPVGMSLEDPDQYRFAEHEGDLVFGPYLVDDRRYYYSSGEVLDNNLTRVDRPEVKGLHNFYLKTYLDPLFYSPGDELNLSGFEKFEKDKVLAESCGLEYDVVPQEFFNELEKNKDGTEAFFNRASMNNAEELVSQNRETVDAYGGMNGEFIDLIGKDVTGNDCFVDVKEGSNSLATNTPVNYGIDEKVLINYSRMANRNAEKALNQIKGRQKILRGDKDYDIKVEDVSEGYNKSDEDFDLSYNSSEALNEFNDRRIEEYLELKEGSAPDDVSDGSNKSSNFSGNEDIGDEARLASKLPQRFDMRSYCLGGDFTPVYGWEKDVYPNIISGEEIVQDYDTVNLKDFFTVCRCPYVEITRLKWYVLNDQYRKISEAPVSSAYTGVESSGINKSERSFIEDPGESSASNLSEKYESALRENLRSGNYHDSLPVMWERNVQEESNLHRFEQAYDDFWNREHMDVWSKYYDVTGNESFGRGIYNYFLVTESGYSMNFMTYSESVWRLEDKPNKFSGRINVSASNQQFIFS